MSPNFARSAGAVSVSMSVLPVLRSDFRIRPDSSPAVPDLPYRRHDLRRLHAYGVIGVGLPGPDDAVLIEDIGRRDRKLPPPRAVVLLQVDAELLQVQRLDLRGDREPKPVFL